MDQEVDLATEGLHSLSDTICVIASSHPAMDRTDGVPESACDRNGNDSVQSFENILKFGEYLRVPARCWNGPETPPTSLNGAKWGEEIAILCV